MTPVEILTPIILGLAAYGYVRLMSRYFWGVLGASALLAGVIIYVHPFRPDDALIWISSALLGLIALALSRLWPEPPTPHSNVHQPKQSSKPVPCAKKPSRKAREIVIDGTNVLFWDGDTAELSTLRAVVNTLKSRGFSPFVFLDASSRHHLKDKSLDEAKFAQALGLQRPFVMVCPAGTEADSFILKFAKTEGLAIVSNDRFGDRAPQARGIKLVKGTFARGRPIFQGL